MNPVFHRGPLRSVYTASEQKFHEPLATMGRRAAPIRPASPPNWAATTVVLLLFPPPESPARKTIERLRNSEKSAGENTCHAFDIPPPTTYSGKFSALTRFARAIPSACPAVEKISSAVASPFRAH